MAQRQGKNKQENQKDMIGVAPALPPLSVTEFRAAFADAIKTTLDKTSVNASRNRPIEALVARQTGWTSVGVKFISASKQIKNRISELRNRPEGLTHALLLVPEELTDIVSRHAAQYVGTSGKFSAIAIATHDSEPPRITDLVLVDEVRGRPEALRAVFPDIHIHLVPPLREVREPVTPYMPNSPTAFSIDDFVNETGIERSVAQTWLRRLLRKRQLAFQGPPGTGKTFIAKRLAQLLVSDAGGSVEIVQFHPSYSYEDFVQGIRPIVEGGHVTYALNPGHFLRFCEVARQSPGVPFALIIDEMNRGNLSRIFGELLFLLEYRHESIPLAQSDHPFSVPDNVYLIATMNTADRSIAILDHALRRRFTFVFLEPDYDLLRRHLVALDMDSKQLPELLQRINASIGDRHYHLGTSFFLSGVADLKQNLKDIWEGEIEPYLDEYFFDQPKKVDEFRWQRLIASALSWWVITDGTGISS